MKGMHSGPDLTGERFGILTVIGRSHLDKWRARHWLLQCECGSLTTGPTSHLLNGSVKSCGCGLHRTTEQRSQAQRKEFVGYLGAHTRVRTARGSVQNYPCVDCGKQAAEWTYDGLDPNALTEPHGTHANAGGCLYSLDIEHYHPRCRSCHKRHDFALRPPAPPKPPASHCGHGHELSPENVYVDSTGYRSCRACNREQAARYRAKQVRAAE